MNVCMSNGSFFSARMRGRERKIFLVIKRQNDPIFRDKCRLIYFISPLEREREICAFVWSAPRSDVRTKGELLWWPGDLAPAGAPGGDVSKRARVWKYVLFLQGYSSRYNWTFGELKNKDYSQNSFATAYTSLKRTTMYQHCCELTFIVKTNFPSPVALYCFIGIFMRSYIHVTATKSNMLNITMILCV